MGPRGFQRFLLGFAALLAAALLVEVLLRVAFPWDFYVWSESPFLTNMIKLAHGQPIYSDPADGNSFVYSPGAEYLTYALLRPLALHLDIRACRVVVVLTGLAASACAASFSVRVARALGATSEDAPRARGLWLFAFLASSLIVFGNLTSDVCHPDNLHVLWVTASLALAARTAEKNSYKWALATVAFGCVGLWAKQTAVLSGVSVAVGLALINARSWGTLRAALLVVFAVGVTSVAAGALFASSPFARLYTFDLLRRHPIELWRVRYLVSSEVMLVPHRALLVLLAPACAFHAWQCDRPAARRMVVLWACVGALGVPLTLLSYLKAWGFNNNLLLLDVWTAVLVVPMLWRSLSSAALVGEVAVGTIGAGVLCVLLLGLVPTRLPPTHEEYEFGRSLDAMISADAAANRRILLGHGTMPLIHAGVTSVPLDRSNSVGELATGNMASLSSIDARIRLHYYDRIYAGVGVGFTPETQRVIEAAYSELPGIAPPRSRVLTPEILGTGNMGLMEGGVRVFVPRTAEDRR